MNRKAVHLLPEQAPYGGILIYTHVGETGLFAVRSNNPVGGIDHLIFRVSTDSKCTCSKRHATLVGWADLTFLDLSDVSMTMRASQSGQLMYQEKVIGSLFQVARK